MAKKPTARMIKRARTYAPTVTVERQKLTARMVEKLRHKHEASDPGALLEAIDFCFRAGMPAPVWLAEAWCARYEEWAMYRVKSLDEAFGVSRPKKMHINRAAIRKRLKARVVFEVLRLHREKNLPIDQDIFPLVGKVLNISGGLANKIYYDHDEPARFVRGPRRTRETNAWREFLPLFEVLRDPEIS